MTRMAHQIDWEVGTICLRLIEGKNEKKTRSYI